jgi:hypothetical protein
MHNGRLITVFSARNYMDAIDNDSALLLLTYDDTKSLRVRIKTLSKKDMPPSVVETATAASPRHAAAAAASSTASTPSGGAPSEPFINEQFGKIRPHSNLLDALLIVPDTTAIDTVTGPLRGPGGGGGGGGGEGETGEGEDGSQIDSIMIDYSGNAMLCSSLTNLNDIIRETNHKSDRRFFKHLKAVQKKFGYGASTEAEGGDEMGGGGGGGGVRNSSGSNGSGSDEEEGHPSGGDKKVKETFVKRLRHSVREMFTRSTSKEIK